MVQEGWAGRPEDGKSPTYAMPNVTGNREMFHMSPFVWKRHLGGWIYPRSAKAIGHL